MNSDNLEPPINLCEKVLKSIRRERRILFIKKTVLSSTLVVGIIVGAGTTTIFIYKGQSENPVVLSTQGNKVNDYSIQHPYAEGSVRTVFTKKSYK
jgi:hypothetical protein